MRRKIREVVLLCVCSVMLLSGCATGNDGYVEFTVKHDENVEPWGFDDLGLYDSNTNLDKQIIKPSEQTIDSSLETGVEANILGIYEVSEDGGEQNVVSQLVAGKDYEVRARVLSSTDAILDQELDFLLTIPTVVEKGKKFELTILVSTDAVAIAMDEFTVTTSAHDLRLSYVPDTYRVSRNGGVGVRLPIDGVVWEEHVDCQEQSLGYTAKVKQQLGVYEYVIHYNIHAELLESQQEKAEQQATEPLIMKLGGISHQYYNNEASALMALNDCLREDYFVRETVSSEGMVYIVVEVVLPDWAREFAEQYGLILTWYSYPSNGLGIGVTLPTFPDNLGHAEVIFENLQIRQPFDEDGKPKEAICELLSYPTTPLSVWSEMTEASFMMNKLAMVEMPTECTMESRTNRMQVTQLLGGEVIQNLPEDNRFYVVAGTDIIEIPN